jgi:hypothetical protein
MVGGSAALAIIKGNVASLPALRLELDLDEIYENSGC